MNSVKPTSVGICEVCATTLQEKQQRFCSFQCRDVFARERRPSKEILIELLKSKSREAVGRDFKVTGNAVKKWQKAYGIPTIKVIPSRAEGTPSEGVETSGEV